MDGPHFGYITKLTTKENSASQWFSRINLKNQFVTQQLLTNSNTHLTMKPTIDNSNEN
jgi:hypothetical protein